MHSGMMSCGPIVSPHRFHHERQPPSERQQQRQRVLGLFVEAEVRHVGDDDAAASGRGHVDLVRARSQPSDHAAASQFLDDRFRHTRRNDQQRVAVFRRREDFVRLLPFDLDELRSGPSEFGAFRDINRIGDAIESDGFQHELKLSWPASA